MKAWVKQSLHSLGLCLIPLWGGALASATLGQPKDWWWMYWMGATTFITLMCFGIFYAVHRHRENRYKRPQ